MTVLAILMVIVALANVVLSTMLNQSKLTHHQVTRIQAYYAALGYANYTYQKLFLNDDPVGWPAAFTKTFCRSGCDVNDQDLPFGIERIDVVVQADSAGRPGIREIVATAFFRDVSNY